MCVTKKSNVELQEIDQPDALPIVERRRGDHSLL